MRLIPRLFTNSWLCSESDLVLFRRKTGSILDLLVDRVDWLICLWRRAVDVCGKTLAILRSLWRRAGAGLAVCIARARSILTLRGANLDAFQAKA